jgi:ABC-type lipoprotein release transport system permease subunit
MKKFSVVFQLIFKEILFRKLNFLLGLLAIVMAVALFVSFFTTSEASKRETIRLTRDMGFNLRIIPRETDMDAFWIKGFSEYTMPEEYLFRFADNKSISYAHLTATLNKKMTWHNKDVIITGISSEIEPSGREKTPMIFTIQRGSIYLGFELAHGLGIRDGDNVDILGKMFTIEKTLSETGSDDDIRIYAQLEDVQEILGMQGKINEIKALNCLCLTSDEEDPLVILRDQLSQVLPEAKVIMNKTIAVARERQRLMLEEYFAFIIPFVIIACAAWIGALIMVNVRDRRAEIGLLRALGYGGGKIASLFLGKAVLFGILGAAIGFALGTASSLSYGPGIFKVTANTIMPLYGLLGWSVILAVAFAMLSAFIPALIAVTQDPAQTLRGE